MPEFRTRDRIAQRLGLPPARVGEILDFLCRTGLAKSETDGSFLPTEHHTLLGSDAPLISKRHTNWRIRAITSLDHARREDLHFSSAISVSKSDAARIRELTAKHIEAVHKIVDGSEPEDLYSFCVDFFLI